jgi:alpha-beta hydrolase superfamily lysophospholipase
VLNVADIQRYAAGLGRDVTYVAIEGGKHDLVLSPETARNLMFSELDTWMRAKLGASTPA